MLLLFAVKCPEIAIERSMMTLTRSSRKQEWCDMKILEGSIELNNEELSQNIAFFRQPRIPFSLERLIEDYISRKVGRRFDDPVILDRIRGAITRQKDLYWKERKRREIPYDKGYDVFGYLAYQLPVYVIQFEFILFQLAMDGLLKRDLKILDAGTGPGVVPLAAIDFFSRLQQDYHLDINAIERADEHREAFLNIVPAFRRDTERVSLHPVLKADIRVVDADELPSDVDLIVFQNVLNEIKGSGPKEQSDIVRRFLSSLRDAGSLLLIEPADHANATGLRWLVDVLTTGGMGLYGPCTYIRGTRCRPVDCWTFEEKTPIQPTTLMKALASSSPEPYRYINTDIKYASAILRKDNRTKIQYRVPLKAKYAIFSSFQRHIGRYINTVGSVMSGDLGDAGTHVFKICDGTAGKPVYAILPSYHVNATNRALLAMPYGKVVILQQVLVRYNPRYGSYNLLINKQSRISPAG
jgi:hypothetical protein